MRSRGARHVRPRVRLPRGPERELVRHRDCEYYVALRHTSSLLGQHAERFDRKAIFFVHSDLFRINVYASWVTENRIVFNLHPIRLFSQCCTNERKLLSCTGRASDPDSHWLVSARASHAYHTTTLTRALGARR
jgi:hypothetical protein